jgi:hypothetical protein
MMAATLALAAALAALTAAALTAATMRRLHADALAYRQRLAELTQGRR